jgi:CHAD domain-containing protein
MKWDAGKSAQENAATRLPVMARKFFTAGDAAARPEASPQQMHVFRLRTKQFRYTLEFFEPVYNERIEPALEALRQLQKHLGEINDCATTLDLLNERKDVGARLARALRESLDQKSAATAEEFREFWSEAFGAGARRREWLTLLKDAGTPAKSGRALKSVRTSRPPREST